MAESSLPLAIGVQIGRHGRRAVARRWHCGPSSFPSPSAAANTARANAVGDDASVVAIVARALVQRNVQWQQEAARDPALLFHRLSISVAHIAEDPSAFAEGIEAMHFVPDRERHLPGGLGHERLDGPENHGRSFLLGGVLVILPLLPWRRRRCCGSLRRRRKRRKRPRNRGRRNSGCGNGMVGGLLCRSGNRSGRNSASNRRNRMRQRPRHEVLRTTSPQRP
mmetsp:Transcript_76442/g.220940  ORF Transcript_76442/g.220940 Transcript_76442/m.220940 type:complete len:223 (-) Transcript_76442:610-1278(-)